MRSISRVCLVATALAAGTFSIINAHPTVNKVNERSFEVQGDSSSHISVAKDANVNQKLLFERPRTANKSPVPVEMFVMSKCPDAADCVSKLILPVMANISDSGVLTLQPTYIGTPDDSNAGMACMHGPDECLGDMLELCAYDMYKPTPKIWLGFIHCLGNDYKSIPDNDFVHDCAKEYGVDFEKLSDCAGSVEPNGGIELLRESAKRAIQLGIRTSCTVTVNGKTACVRDNGQWKDCTGKPEDLSELILKAYNDEDGEGSSD